MLFIFNSGKSLVGYSRKKKGINIKIKNKNYITVETITKSNIKVVQRGKLNALTRKYISVHFPVLLQALQLNVAEMIQSCKCFPYVSKMPTLTTGRIMF